MEERTMKEIKSVQSTVRPLEIEFDESHVYLNTNIKEVPESERQQEKEQLEEGQELGPLFSYNVKEYEKDEFLQALSAGQVSLNGRATALEDMILEMSSVVYA